MNISPLVFTAIMTLCVGCKAAEAPATAPIHVTSEAIALHSKNPEVQNVGALTYRGGLRLSSAAARFGGFSGLILSADGDHMIAVSDRGSLLEAGLNYDDSGRLSGISGARLCLLNDSRGSPVEGLNGDAEAIVQLPDGALAISFERDHRVVTYAAPGRGMTPCDGVGAARLFHKMGEWHKMPPNGGFEAMTLLEDGTLFVLSEDARTEGGLIKGWLIRSRKSDTVFYRPTEKFLPTDMVRLPTGDLLVLERRFSILAGVSSRLCRVKGSSIQPGATLDCKTAARIVSPFTTENYEGLAARTAANGSTVVYMLSDDNFNAFQSTILMMFVLNLDELD